MRDHELLRRFLLGELEKRKAERVEKRLLKDDELFDLCEAIEAELLDAVARGELAPAERERVLQRLASSPQGRARLALAESLVVEAADRRASTESMPAPLPFRRRPSLTASPAVRWAMAAGLVAVILGGAGTVWRIVSHPGEGDQLASVEPTPEQEVIGGTTTAPPYAGPVAEPTPPPAEEPSPDEGSAPVQIAEDRPAESPAFPVPLSLDVLRGGEEGEEIAGGSMKVEIPGGTERVELQVDLAGQEGFETYDVSVTRQSGGEVEKGRVRPQPIGDSNYLVLSLKTKDLPAGRYEVKVQGNSAVGTQETLRTWEIEVSHGE